jgi:hypothetical protein
MNWVSASWHYCCPPAPRSTNRFSLRLLDESLRLLDEYAALVDQYRG